ncbi:hypothetical protein FVO59_14225 [Microbacterium esteraromaticum]|uniref:Uncharacterized protein n=1 Tax=Microbacterium esteraromaticum TaxID=57043 RepID=A0A7D7WGT6_9MICO|nr:hypothetical protein [Microbacterium esteraromaticum]QMU98212.1 hypothetical protein FVO59_14225 [Microbacterium esteraromaticum]
MTSGYNRVHYLLRRDRGSAVGRPCVVPGCARLADGWGLVGEATHYGEKGGDGKPVRWSTDLNDYAPLCYSHNSQLDRGGDLLMCPRGHVRLTWGVTSNGECVGCRRERLREHKRRLRADPGYRARENAQRQEQRKRRAERAKNGEQP